MRVCLTLGSWQIERAGDGLDENTIATVLDAYAAAIR
jgi:hypothetical protein